VIHKFSTGDNVPQPPAGNQCMFVRRKSFYSETDQEEAGWFDLGSSDIKAFRRRKFM
jgi:hypothetical protein